MKRVILVLIALSVLEVCLGGCQTGGTPTGAELDLAPTSPAAQLVDDGEPRSGGIVVISYGGGTPRHLNPALVSGSSTAIPGAQIFASPLRYDENWNPQPYLAERWEVSEDGLSVTLHLVEGATFHDGEPITSADVAFSLMTVKTYHPFKSMFAPVEEVETPDDYTAIIRLSRPHPAILLAMSPALLPIIPEHVYGDGQDLLTHPANLAPVGSGPFKLVAFVPDEFIELERYDGFFIPGRPYLDRIVIRLESDPDAQVIEMVRQDAHLLGVYTDLDRIDQLSEYDHLVVTPQGYEGLGALNWLAFNLQRSPLDDVRVRQAIAYAVDPDFIIQHLHHGRTQRATGPIAPDSPFYESDVSIYDLDLARAAALLDDAGYPVDADGIRFALTIDYIPVIPSQQRDVALYLKRQLAQIGIDVQARDSATFLEWAERIGNWDFDMTMDSVYNWGDPVIGVHRTYLCDNIRQGVVWSNTQNYCNPRVDELLSQAERELDPERRKALYSEFQQIVTEELPVVWINVLPYRTIYHAGLGNPPLSIWGLHSPLDELYWREPPAVVYAPVPSLQAASPLVEVTAVRAIELLQQENLYEVREILADSDQGFLDLEGSGLHVIGFTRQGGVFLDNSGQLKPGMDISGILDLQGNPLLPLFLDAADDEHDHSLVSEGVWPHPVTNEASPMSGWCEMLTDQDVVCALEWDQGGEE